PPTRTPPLPLHDALPISTRRSDGTLVARPMATQERLPGADLWFVTDISTHKIDELEQDPHVNVSYYRDRTREWVSVSGTARVSQDRKSTRLNSSHVKISY